MAERVENIELMERREGEEGTAGEPGTPRGTPQQAPPLEETSHEVDVEGSGSRGHYTW